MGTYKSSQFSYLTSRQRIFVYNSMNLTDSFKMELTTYIRDVDFKTLDYEEITDLISKLDTNILNLYTNIIDIYLSENNLTENELEQIEINFFDALAEILDIISDIWRNKPYSKFTRTVRVNNISIIF